MHHSRSGFIAIGAPCNRFKALAFGVQMLRPMRELICLLVVNSWTNWQGNHTLQRSVEASIMPAASRSLYLLIPSTECNPTTNVMSILLCFLPRLWKVCLWFPRCNGVHLCLPSHRGETMMPNPHRCQSKSKRTPRLELISGRWLGYPSTQGPTQTSYRTSSSQHIFRRRYNH